MWTKQGEERYEQNGHVGSIAEYYRQNRATMTRRQVNTDDADFPDDDVLYDTRPPTSVRRYQPPAQTEIRVRRYQGAPPQTAVPPRTHKELPAPQLQAHPRRRSARFYIGVGMVTMALLYLLVDVGSNVVGRVSDDMHYGYPRTYQCDADVKHGSISHFIVENLHGHVFIIEMHVNDPGKTKIYVGPVMTGADADLEPVTVTFQDENGDRLPDMLLQVGTNEYLFLNTGQEFRSATQPIISR